MQTTEQESEQPAKAAEHPPRTPSLELRVLRFAMAQVAAASRAAPPRSAFTRGAPEAIRLRHELQWAMTGLCIARAAHRRQNNNATTPHHVELRRLDTRSGSELSKLPTEESDRLAAIVLETARSFPASIIEVAAAVGRSVRTGLPVSMELGRELSRSMATAHFVHHLETCPEHGVAHAHGGAG